MKKHRNSKSNILLFIMTGGLIMGLLISLFIIREELVRELLAERGSRWVPEIGSTVSDFELINLQGQTVKFSEFHDSTVIINFWGTWCPPCKEEMPLLQKMYEKYSPGLVVLGVNVQDSPEQVRQFVNESQIIFPILLDEEASVAEQFNVRAFPTTFIVDSRGILRVQHIGLLFEDIFIEYLEKVEVEL